MPSSFIHVALAAILATVLFVVAALLWLGFKLVYFDGRFDAARLELGPDDPALARPEASALRAFYSGHSLSDGVPDALAPLARSLGKSFDYEQQSLPGSLLRERTKGADPNADGFPGLRQGKNKDGSGLDVEAALRTTGPDAYDVLVVTERHDLPYAVRAENTIGYLRALHDRFMQGNPQGQTFLYHTWLELDLDDPAHFVDYERKLLPMWECVASAVNRGLARQGRSDRVLVLPGATALADLVELVARGELTALPGASARERLSQMFEDQVHLTELGRYFMANVHYAALFGSSPEGGAAPAGVSEALARELQRVAWAHVERYRRTARSAAERGAELCTDYAKAVVCPAFTAHPRGEDAVGTISRLRQNWRCRQAFTDPTAERPFGDE